MRRILERVAGVVEASLIVFGAWSCLRLLAQCREVVLTLPIAW
jgi:hypothetical protein